MITPRGMARKSADGYTGAMLAHALLLAASLAAPYARADSAPPQRPDEISFQVSIRPTASEIAAEIDVEKRRAENERRRWIGYGICVFGLGAGAARLAQETMMTAAGAARLAARQ